MTTLDGWRHDVSPTVQEVGASRLCGQSATRRVASCPQTAEDVRRDALRVVHDLRPRGGHDGPAREEQVARSFRLVVESSSRLAGVVAEDLDCHLDRRIREVDAELLAANLHR